MNNRSCINCNSRQTHRFKYCSHCGNQVEKISDKISQNVQYDYSAHTNKFFNKVEPEFTITDDGYKKFTHNPKIRPMQNYIEQMEFHKDFLDKVEKASKPYLYISPLILFLGWGSYIFFGFHRINSLSNIPFPFVFHAFILFSLVFISNKYSEIIDRFFRKKIGGNYDFKYHSNHSRYINFKDIYAKNSKLKCIYCGNTGTYFKGAYEGKHNPTPGYTSCSACETILFYH